MKAADLNPNPADMSDDDVRLERTGRYDMSNARRMRRLINRLLDESSESSQLDDQQTPAMECNVTIRGLMQPLSGALSITPEGTLKLLVRVAGKAGEAPTLMEVFFDYTDVTTVAVERQVTASVGSRIIQSS